LSAAVIRLAAFDLDGTLIHDRTCVESVARMIGREEECAAFERLDMRDVPLSQPRARRWPIGTGPTRAKS
jgi:phosphoserine phosphatase